MTTNKTGCKIQQSIFYPTLLSSIFIEVVLAAFIGTLQITFDTLFAASVISSHITTELSIILLAYPPFLQLHVKGFCT